MYRAPYLSGSSEEATMEHEAVGDASPPNPPTLMDIPEPSQPLLDAARNKDEDTVRRLVEEGANLSVKNADGHTALHLAAHNDDESIVKFLAGRWINLEAAAANGDKPLYIAAGSGYVDIADILLDFGANVEAFNAETHQTAFYRAVETGHFEIAKLLLQNGAKIDARSSTGLTPLFCAVAHGDAEFVEYLLEHGANKNIQLADGRTVKDFVKDGEINILLLSDQVLQGPSIADSLRPNQERRSTFTPLLPEDQIYKQYACRGFDATIVDFFLGDREQRIQVTESVYEILYGDGPAAIMDAAKGTKLSRQQPRLRWYHLPANNMEWVEKYIRNAHDNAQLLISRIFAEKGSSSEMLDEELKSKLALRNSAGRQYHTLTAQSSSFMRPLFQTVNGRERSLAGDTTTADHMVLFMPYLHFETRNGYEQMISHIKHTRESNEPLIIAPEESRNHRTRKHNLSHQQDDTPTETDTDLISSTHSRGHNRRKQNSWNNVRNRTEQLRLTFQELKRQLALFESARNTTVEKEDLEKGTVTNARTATNMPGMSSRDKEPTNFDGPERELTAERHTQEQDIEVEQSFRQEKDAGGSSTDKRVEEPHPSAKPSDVSSSEAQPVAKSQIHNQSQGLTPKTATTRRRSQSKMAKGDRNNLINAATGVVGDATGGNRYIGVLPRPTTFDGQGKLAGIPEGAKPRTRYHGNRSGPAFEKSLRANLGKPQISLSRIDEILIRAYLLPSFPGQVPSLQLRRTLDQYFYTGLANTHQRDTDQVVLRYTMKYEREPKIFMVDQLWLWVLNGDTVISCFPHRWATPSTDAIPVPPPPPPSIEKENKTRMQDFLQEDPLNVHQTILKNLRISARSPITSISDLANLIISSCADVFDQNKILPDFQFFDFFESSIGHVSEEEAQCFQSFRRSLESDSNISPRIGDEVKLLVEIKDIRDELGILEIVLKDQMKVLEEFDQAMTDKEQNLAYPHTKVLGNHLDRIQQMDKLAEKTYQALNGLLDLKQKQANVSEAFSARKQAEIAAQHAEQGVEHAKLAMMQATETARQGKTVLLFTVVTIIFLPLSFMAAFFAISIESFPVNDDGRLPMSYVLKYMLTISAAISIPFILIAFNQDRITKWLRGLAKPPFWWSCLFVVLLILLPVVWTSDLASNIKVALTVAVILLSFLAGIGQIIHKVVRAARNVVDSDLSTSSGESFGSN